MFQHKIRKARERRMMAGDTKNARSVTTALDCLVTNVASG